MVSRVIWGILIALVVQFGIFAVLFGVLQAISPTYLAETFIVEKFQDSPELIPVLKTLFYEIAGGVVGAAGIFIILWLVLVSFSGYASPTYARSKRSVWWILLIVGVIATPFIGYFVSSSATLVAENVPVELGLGAAVLYLVSYWVGSVLATAHMFRAAVPFAVSVAGWIKFP